MHTRLIVYNPIFMACDEARVSEADADVPEVDEQTEILSFGRMPPLDCMGRIWNVLLMYFDETFYNKFFRTFTAYFGAILMSFKFADNWLWFWWNLL